MFKPDDWPETSTLPEWSQDELRTTVKVELSVWDRLRLLFGWKLEIDVKTYAENVPGRVETYSRPRIYNPSVLRRPRQGGVAVSHSGGWKCERCIQDVLLSHGSAVVGFYRDHSMTCPKRRTYSYSGTGEGKPIRPEGTCSCVRPTLNYPALNFTVSDFAQCGRVPLKEDPAYCAQIDCEECLGTGYPARLCRKRNPNPLPLVTDGYCEQPEGHEGCCIFPSAICQEEEEDSSA